MANDSLEGGLVSRGQVKVELDTGYEVDAVLVWNYNRADLLTRGATDVNVLVSPTLDGDFTDLGNFTLAAGGGGAEAA